MPCPSHPCWKEYTEKYDDTVFLHFLTK
jgi:hypothetical protein